MFRGRIPLGDCDNRLSTVGAAAEGGGECGILFTLFEFGRLALVGHGEVSASQTGHRTGYIKSDRQRAFTIMKEVEGHGGGLI